MPYRRARTALLAAVLTAPILQAGDGESPLPPEATATPAIPRPGTPAPVENRPSLLGSLFAPGALARVSLSVAFEQARDGIPQWDQGADGLKRRARAAFAAHVVRTSTQYSLASLRHTDTSYARCQCKGFPSRARHALVSEFVERRADGRLAWPVARLAGVYASAFAILPLLPHGYGASDAINRGNVFLAGDIGVNLLQEFNAEIRRALLHGRFRPVQ